MRGYRRLGRLAPLAATGAVALVGVALLDATPSAASGPEKQYAGSATTECVLAPGILNEKGTFSVAAEFLGPERVGQGESGIQFNNAVFTLTSPVGFANTLFAVGARKVKGKLSSLILRAANMEPKEKKIEGPSFEAPVEQNKPFVLRIPHEGGLSLGPYTVTGKQGENATLELKSEAGFRELGEGHYEETGAGIVFSLEGVNATGEHVIGPLTVACGAPALLLAQMPIGPPRPTVTKIEPGQGSTAGGTSVTITGTNFNTAGDEVRFGGNRSTSVAVHSSTSITAVSPPGVGIVDVQVVSDGGASEANPADKFTYQVPAAQWVLNAKLASGQPTSVTLWGEVTLSGGPFSEITCQDIMSGSVWNENGRGVGQVEGFATGGCENAYLQHCLLEECPFAFFESGELPLVVEKREAETCIDRTKTELNLCPPPERKPELLTLHLRRLIGLPWKLRLARETREEEPAIVVEIGLPPSGETCYPKEVLEGKEVAARWERVPSGCVRLDEIVPRYPAEDVFYGTLTPRLVNGAGNGLNASHLELGAAAGQLALEGSTAPAIGSQGQIKVAGSEARELITAR
jgi:hypothetical protein